jgi:CRISPR-associated protein Cas1
MLDINEFNKKQIIVFFPAQGDKISYQNDNMVIRDGNRKIKYQLSCYRIFMLIVVGDASFTTGILRRIRKYGITICFMTMGFKVYGMIGSEMQGNTALHKRQYEYNGLEVARHIIGNKIENQRRNLLKMRSKLQDVKDAVNLLEKYRDQVLSQELKRDELIGIEGIASKVYFSRVFNNVKWIGRKPRIKMDYVNALLDIGYTILFNFIDAILSVFGFDVYYGVLHTCFYMRKSLVCDIMEPFRPLVDWQVRKGINLGQFKEDDFKRYNNRWELEYKKSAQYTQALSEIIMKYKDNIFLYVRSYYRCVMKQKNFNEYPIFLMEGV